MTREELKHLDVFLFSLDEARAILRVSRQKLKSYIAAGELDVVRFGSRIMIANEDLRTFINNHKARMIKDEKIRKAV